MIIEYNIHEYSCTTPCPYNEIADTNTIIFVGSIACSNCMYYGSNRHNQTILCLKESQPSLPNIDKLTMLPDLR